MDAWAEQSEAAFDAYVGALIGVAGHTDRVEPLKTYCVGPLTPMPRQNHDHPSGMPQSMTR